MTYTWKKRAGTMKKRKRKRIKIKNCIYQGQRKRFLNRHNKSMNKCFISVNKQKML